MQPSYMRTLSVPATPTENPVRLLGAGSVPLRVVARNVAATDLRLSFVITNLTGAPSSEVFALPVGAEEILILAPQQVVYAVAVGGVGAISLAASEAFPVG